MDTDLSPPDLANTITGFATLLSGLTAWIFSHWVGPQPGRWRFVYACIVVTGVFTVGWHGWATESLRILDVGTNLLVVWAIQLAILGDYDAPATRNRVAAASGALNLLGIAWMAREAATGVRHYVIDLGAFGGFYAGEALLIFDAFLATALFYRQRARIPRAAKPLLWSVTGIFLVGLGLATAAGTTVHHRILSYHALWHLVGAFGFLFLWAFNHVRFAKEPLPSRG